jgi:hypothetical protein
MLGLSGILVHSAVDFNLQIPANAALFYAGLRFLFHSRSECFAVRGWSFRRVITSNGRAARHGMSG